MIAESAARLCEAQFCFVYRFDGHLLHFVAHHGLTPDVLEINRRAYPAPPGRRSVAARAVLDRGVAQIPDVNADPDYALGAMAEVGGYRSAVAVPILRDGLPIGSIAVTRAQTGLLPDRQIELLRTFADQAVIAIENARLFEQVQARTRELSAALQLQTATADVLKIISRSTFELQTVLDTLVESAARLCEADMATVTRPKGDSYHHVAHYGASPGVYDFLKNLTLSPGRGSVVGRVLSEGRTVQIPDVLADPEYTFLEAQKKAGWRTLLGVPLLREGSPIGVIVLWRCTVRPFTARHIELLTTFADQAVIAIENARLFDEVQARTRDLAESLQQQTATADVLKVISRSTFDLQTVLDTLVESAARLCEADTAGVTRQRGASFYHVAHYSFSPRAFDYIKDVPLSPGRGSVVGRVLSEGRTVQIPDALADPEYDLFEAQKIMGFRTLLGVPLLREGIPIGVLALTRSIVRPFTDKQIELVATFADQAVIAIENARLFDEVQEKSRELELANTYKSRFLAAASHDLRQPLHALNLFVAQLRAESDPAERSRLVARIDAAVSAMNELFDALLDMSKLDAGVLAPNLTAFPVDHLLKRMETTFADASREKGLQLRVVPSSAWVRSDFILLERILLNLVSNAVRYTPRGGVVVGCRRRGERLRIDVWDSGVGIPEDQQGNIFGEFYQLAGAERDRRGGLGLGLSIVDRLGRLLDHTVELQSRPGRGSRFSVSVNLAVARPQSADAQVAPAAIADPAQGKLIVVIDDDALVLDGMRGILQSWGCNVVAAPSDDAALAQLAQQGEQPDLIISDYRLADGKTGIGAIERIRDALGVPVPAFLISGDTAPERLRDASASGYHLLHKPVPPMKLRAMLNRLLKRRNAAGASRRSQSSRRHGPDRNQALPPR
jgi:GAF domain-containing protein/DNA-binding NarL/FixJ family response regulator/anti-sigma regulatory factor (Ser/Thr protein kinase)